MSSNIFSEGARKLLSFPDRLADWTSGKPVVPVALEIQPSERCNHRCPDCQARFAIPMSDLRSRAEKGAFLDLRLLDSVWEEPPAGVILSGNTGDPLLHPQISELLHILSKQGIPSVLVTNLQALTPEVADAALKACNGIRVSMDAIDAASYTMTHGATADWDVLLENIKHLVRRRQELGQEEQCHVGAGYLTSAATAKGMLGAASLCRDLGLDYIQFRPFHFKATNISAELRECHLLETGGFKVYASEQKYSRVNNQARAYDQCHGANFYTVIDARADLYICCHHIGNPSARFGSLRDQTWSRIIRSIERRQVLQNFGTHSCIPLCRLHSHNQALNEMKNGCCKAEPVKDAKILQHAAFL